MDALPTVPSRGKSPGAAARPFSIRLTDSEKRHLLDCAGGKPLGTFLRSLVLTESLTAPRKSFRPSPAPVKDHELLGRLLGKLGESRIANNLNQLAKAVNVGALLVSPETEAEITEACRSVVAMRQDLMGALGLRSKGRS